jgi:hypothetical protein
MSALTGLGGEHLRGTRVRSWLERNARPEDAAAAISTLESQLSADAGS